MRFTFPGAVVAIAVVVAAFSHDGFLARGFGVGFVLTLSVGLVTTSLSLSSSLSLLLLLLEFLPSTTTQTRSTQPGHP